jgi:hypothetical protein
MFAQGSSIARLGSSQTANVALHCGTCLNLEVGSTASACESGPGWAGDRLQVPVLVKRLNGFATATGSGTGPGSAFNLKFLQ